MLRTATCCLLVALVGAVDAAPPKHRRATSTSPALAAAEQQWAAAAAEPDGEKAAAKWQAAAEAFLAAAEKAAAGSPERKDAALGAVMAWKNALDVDPRVKAELPVDFSKVPAPKAMPDADRKMVKAFERYLAIDRASDDAVGVLFASANLYRRHDHVDKALPIFHEIIRQHPRHETAEYAANLVLDTYNRMQDFEKLIAFAEKLRGDKAFLARREELASTVEKIHIQAARKGVERVEKQAIATRDRDLFDRCGEMYLDLAREAGPRSPSTDEHVYNAGVCFQEAGSLERAMSAFAAVPRNSRLRGRVLGRSIEIHARTAHFAEAAAAGEEYARTFTGERDAFEAARDALHYRMALGELDKAESLLKFSVKTFRKGSSLDVEPWQLAQRYLEQGKRTEARRLLAEFPDPKDPSLRLQAARVIFDAACSVPLVDDGCRGTLDPKLFERATRVARTAVTSVELQLFLLDMMLIASGREDGYAPLLESEHPVQRMAANARLGALALANKQRDQGLRMLAKCSEDASAHTNHRWLQACDRLLGTAGATVEAIGELRSAPQPGGITVDVERPSP